MVNPKQIESELSHIWNSLQRAGKMRACLFNFIIYSKQGQRFEYLEEVAQNVIQKFPSRIIFVTYDDTCFESTLQTAVSVITAKQNSNDIACDLIEIKACKQNHPRVPFVILPHILPDLPIYLLHASDPTEVSPIDYKLESFAHRMIFDARQVAHLPSYARAVLERKDRTRADIADLNWARIEGWRLLLATVFKSESDLHRLQNAKEIKIYFNCAESSSPSLIPTQAIYLQAWIATQLGWKLKSVAKESISYQSTYCPLEVLLIPKRADSLPLGQILSFEVRTRSNFLYKMERDLCCPQNVTIEKSGSQFCGIPFHFFFHQDGSRHSLVREICRRKTSHHYINMLHTLAQIGSEGFFQ